MPKEPNLTLELVGGSQSSENGDGVVDGILSASGMVAEQQSIEEGKVEPSGETKPVAQEPKPGNEGISLKDVLGEGYEDAERVKTLLKRAELFTPDVESELTNLRSLRNDYEEKVKKFQPFKNAAYYKLDKLEESDPANIAVYRNILFGNPDPAELVKLHIMAENPDVFKDDKEALDLYMQDKYPELFGDEVDTDSPEYKRGMTRLKVDANAAKKIFQAKLDSIEVPDPQKQTDDLMARRQEIARKWQQSWDDLKTQFSKVPVVVYDKDGKTPVEMLQIDLNAGESDPLLKQAAQFIVQGMLEPTKENIDSVKRFMLSLWLQGNLPKYNTAIAEHVSKSKDGNWRKLVHNPKTQAQPPKSVGSLDPADSMMDQLKADGEIFSQV